MASTAVAAFLAERAPEAAPTDGDLAQPHPAPPVHIPSWKAFEDGFTAASRTSGEGAEAADGTTVSFNLWAAVYGWFANGGGACYIVPVPSTGEAGTSVYAGDRDGGTAWGLAALEAVDKVTIVVAPDLWTVSSGGPEQARDKARLGAAAIAGHCERMGNRVAVLHQAAGASPADAGWDFTLEPDVKPYTTVYYPWVQVRGLDKDPVSVPPVGHVAGVWARVDANRGVHKAPANEGLRGVIALEHSLTGAEQGELNDNGVNCLRSGQGILVWGARTLAASDTSEVESSYLNVRRSVNFIKQSIRQSTNWAVFEPNDDALQTSVGAMVTSFLRDLWRRGMLVGKSPEEAFYVVCDETNNPPENAAQSKLICDVGVAL
ncbi:phage tail sheath family protein, partial [Streptomyces violascens]|uniref:phage tail sheath family protein n=1 Tax=Streptomyces violascens TaxID=67381 RepID=UPI0036BF5F4E